MPSGVVNFVPADGPVLGNVITQSSELGGINFTGSVPTFRWLWKEVGNNLEKYRCYSILVGECGGKNYHLVHPSADLERTEMLSYFQTLCPRIAMAEALVIMAEPTFIKTSNPR